jgi:protein involved in polysaccharide export with SLBB domain
MRTIVLAVACTLALPVPLASQIVNSQAPNIVTSSGGAYTLRSGDVLRVDVWGRDKYSGLFQVNEEGFIFYPYIGEIDIKEITVSQLRDTLLVELERIFTNPFVSLTPQFRVGVAGHVVRPGLYTVDPTMTILDVISMAGGATELANTGKIRVFRLGESQRLDFEEEMIAARTLTEIGVRSGDDILVPRKFLARPDISLILQAVTVLLSVAIFVNTVN